MCHIEFNVQLMNLDGTPADLEIRKRLHNKLKDIFENVGVIPPKDSNYVGTFFDDDEYHNQPTIVGPTQIASDFAKNNPNHILEMQWHSDDENIHKIIRFYHDQTEVVERQNFYPPFTNIVIPIDNDPEKKEYTVGFKVDARYYATVKARNQKEAIDKARDMFSDCEIGDLECIDAEEINIEDEHGKLTDLI